MARREGRRRYRRALVGGIADWRAGLAAGRCGGAGAGAGAGTGAGRVGALVGAPVLPIPARAMATTPYSKYIPSSAGHVRCALHGRRSSPPPPSPASRKLNPRERALRPPAAVRIAHQPVLGLTWSVCLFFPPRSRPPFFAFAEFAVWPAQRRRAHTC